VPRRDGRDRRSEERLLFLSPEQFSEMTGRTLAEVRAEDDEMARAQADERIRRCRVLVLKPIEHGDMPVEVAGLGSGLDGPLDADELARLGVSPRLIVGPRDWQEGWERRIAVAADPFEFTPGRPLSVRLARQLQAELPAHEVVLDVDGSENLRGG
jgi:hypothetical protein